MKTYQEIIIKLIIISFYIPALFFAYRYVFLGIETNVDRVGVALTVPCILTMLLIIINDLKLNK